MSTIQDVARCANVGAATVSRVLSGNGYVKDETRRKVEEAIRELNYTPNEMARNLYYQKSRIVAIIVPEVSHPFFAEFVSAAEAALSQKGYQTMICNTYYEQSFELRYLEMLKQQRVDGIIFGGHTLDATNFENIQRPIVALDRDIGSHIPCVSADHREGGRLAAQELIAAGCRNVIQFGSGNNVGDYHLMTPSNQRHLVFEEVMKESGAKCYSCVMKWNDLRSSYFRDLSRELFEQFPDLDGAFGTDLPIIALRQVLYEHGRRVPEDVKLIGYDGTSVMGLISPSITYVAQPIAQLAQETVRLVVERIEGRALTQEEMKTTQPVTLVKGDSTRV